jgi:peptide/nickel transport system substrate-binding protein
MKKLIGALFSIAIALAVALPAAAATQGGKLVYARYADSLLLDPVFNDANVDIWILTNLYDTLFLPTDDGKDVQPGLATAWQAADDGMSYTITLRQGVKFADGTPMTADDVKWSLDRATNPKNGIWNFLLASVDSVAVSAPDTITIKLKQPDPVLIKALATFNTAILPQKAYEASAGATDEEKAKAFAEHPVGTGPFKFVSWERNVSMKLARNENYWRKDAAGKQLPYLDEIEFVTIPDDATRILKLQAGEVDGAEFIPYARVAELKADPNLDMQLWPSTKVNFLTLNVRPTYKDGSKNPMADARVRQAMNYAIDKDALIKIVTFDVAKPMVSFMSSSTPYVSGNGPAYPYDQAKAKALLADAGFADGLDVTSLALAGSADETAILSTVQQMWSQVGIRAGRQRHAHGPLSRRRLPDASLRVDRRHRRSQRDRLLLRRLQEHRIDAHGLAGQEGQRPVRRQPEGDGCRQAGGAVQGDPGHLHGGAADHSALRVALSGGTAQVGQGLRADSARQQHLRRRLRGEVASPH